MTVVDRRYRLLDERVRTIALLLLSVPYRRLKGVALESSLVSVLVDSSLLVSYSALLLLLYGKVGEDRRTVRRCVPYNAGGGVFATLCICTYT